MTSPAVPYFEAEEGFSSSENPEYLTEAGQDSPPSPGEDYWNRLQKMLYKDLPGTTIYLTEVGGRSEPLLTLGACQYQRGKAEPSTSHFS